LWELQAAGARIFGTRSRIRDHDGHSFGPLRANGGALDPLPSDDEEGHAVRAEREGGE
jgi:hypothetical protein